MKLRFILLSSVLMVMAHSYAQNVGIGTSSPAAKLDITSTNNGILIPRVSLTGTGDVTSVPSPPTSLLVYNTATAGSGTTAVTPAYYYWSGSAWKQLTTKGNDWSTTGNTGTIDGTNFIGNTDNVPLSFRIANVQAGRIDSSLNNVFFGIGAGKLNSTGYNNVAIGSEALNIDVSGTQNTAIGDLTLRVSTATGNTAIGHAAMYGNSTGGANTALGLAALFTNATGQYNVAIGQQALDNATNGSSTAVGYQAMYNISTGIANSGMGDSVLITNTTGSYLSALGYKADVGSGSLSNATAIGARSQVTTSNSLVLGSVNGANGATANTTVGIGTTGPTQLLDIMGVNQPPATSGTASTALVRLENNTGNGNVMDIGTGDYTMNYGAWIQVTDRGGLNTTYPLDLNPNGGNVGIGVAKPAATLEVNGNAIIDGSLYTRNLPVQSVKNNTSRFALSANTSTYTNESITLTQPANTPARSYRIQMRQMVELTASSSGSIQFTMSTSTTSVTGTPTGMGTPWCYAYNGYWATVTSEGYVTLPANTTGSAVNYTWYVMAASVSGNGIQVANSIADGTAYCNVMAWPM